MSGVVQASPGVMDTPMNGNAFVVPENQSLFRVKMYDDPIPKAETNGLVHFILEYQFARSLIFENNMPEPERIKLYVDKITVKYPETEDKRGGEGKEQERITIQLAGKDAEVLIARDRHYIPFVKNLSLPAGKYRDLRVNFKKTGSLVLNGVEYPVAVETEDVYFNKEFNVNAGKITTLHSVPTREYRGESDSERINAKDKAEIAKNQSEIKNPSQYLSISNPDGNNKKSKELKFQAHIKARAINFTVSDPISEIYIEMLKLEAVNTNGERFLLNDKDTIFELLSLRDGAVALAGHNMLPEGKYAYFELTLGTKNSLVVGGTGEQVVIEYLTQNKLRFEGPFELRGGRITELFLHFDPNQSVFYTNKYGYILDPGVIAASVISMTAEQDLRLIEAIGKKSNQGGKRIGSYIPGFSKFIGCRCCK